MIIKCRDNSENWSHNYFQGEDIKISGYVVGTDELKDKIEYFREYYSTSDYNYNIKVFYPSKLKMTKDRITVKEIIIDKKIAILTTKSSYLMNDSGKTIETILH